MNIRAVFITPPLQMQECVTALFICDVRQSVCKLPFKTTAGDLNYWLLSDWRTWSPAAHWLLVTKLHGWAAWRLTHSIIHTVRHPQVWWRVSSNIQINMRRKDHFLVRCTFTSSLVHIYLRSWRSTNSHFAENTHRHLELPSTYLDLANYIQGVCLCAGVCLWMQLYVWLSYLCHKQLLFALPGVLKPTM